MSDRPENTAAVAPFQRCPTCGVAFMARAEQPSQHRCQPLFECLAEEWDNDWTEVRALDAEWAAKKYVDDHDDYGCEGPTERVLVRVRRTGEQAERVFCVSGEISVVYLAREVKPKSEVQSE